MSSRAILIVFLFVGCGGGPSELIPGAFALPGGVLSGEQVTIQSWSEVVKEDGVMELETRPSDPYSVRVGFVLKGDSMYVDPSDGRKWHLNMKADPAVRVRIEGRVYPATAVPVTDPKEREGFDPDRNVYRLDPVRRLPRENQLESE
ncbi:MAG: nitroreductase family deazaflavin-dependent oxidoreductase [bacterium]|nr:nitroreductase family deazaflavin-dependent oxidoreductase [bacterium]